MYQKLPVDLPLPEATVRISDEGYWKRRMQSTDPYQTFFSTTIAFKNVCKENVVISAGIRRFTSMAIPGSRLPSSELLRKFSTT